MRYSMMREMLYHFVNFFVLLDMVHGVGIRENYNKNRC